MTYNPAWDMCATAERLLKSTLPSCAKVKVVRNATADKFSDYPERHPHEIIVEMPHTWCAHHYSEFKKLVTPAFQFGVYIFRQQVYGDDDPACYIKAIEAILTDIRRIVSDEFRRIAEMETL